MRMERRLRLSKLFGEGCVLQRGEQTRIWGWCMPGVRVSVRIGEKCGEGTADRDGRFEVVFSKLEEGGAFRLTVKSDQEEQVVVEQVFVGEVFVCAGQSNMELPMRRVRERFPEEFWGAGEPDVHVYKVSEHYEFGGPIEDHVQAEWISCGSENLEEISAFSYFFGKFLRENQGVPVGILNLSLGGTPIEAWMSEEVLKRWPEKSQEKCKESSQEYLEIRKKFQDGAYCRRLMEEKEEEERKWYQEIERQERAFETDAGEWKEIRVPGSLAAAGLDDFCGCVWLKRKFEVPKEGAGRRALLRFGTMTDSDQIFVNGVFVGETGYCYPPRRYPIPEGVLREGSNEILIRLVCRNGKGRITTGKPYEILWKDPCSPPKKEGEEELKPIDLEGCWEYQVRAVCEPAPEQEFINRKPTGLFQGMTAPCLSYHVRGVVWYQGESNDCQPERYGELLRGMIADWRRQWRQEKLPFLVVQLPACGVDIAKNEAWPKIREAQQEAAVLEDVAVTVNLDLGEANDLHPLNKKSVAFRASLAARGMIYGEDVVWKGPRVEGWSVKGEEVWLSFDTGDGQELFTKDGQAPAEFEAAGGDGTYRPCRAKIEGHCVRLWTEQVKHPESVRYAWSDAPLVGLICNQSGLCAGPFRIGLNH